jgi:hypothetical protein
MPFNAGYSVGKAGVDQLVRIAADELGPDVFDAVLRGEVPR